MHYILFYDVVSDYLERRTPFREAHLKLALEAHQRGELLLAGAYAEPSYRAALVFRGASAAEDFARNDPYVKNGVVTSWRVRKWMTVVVDDVK